VKRDDDFERRFAGCALTAFSQGQFDDMTLQKSDARLRSRLLD
jgi:hypothetical protein